MCGLAGMVGFLEYKHRNAMKELLYFSALRGKDSTGISCVHRDRTVATRKATMPAYEFIEWPPAEKAMQHADQVWLGHCRYKTTGEINKANAHPFEVLDDEGDILLVGTHNGTLHNKWELERELKGKFDTDSEALFNLLTVKDDFKAAIRKLRGAWSIVFWDPTTDSVHWVRNTERPMYMAWQKDHKVLIYASEPWMIINACKRNGIELETNERGISCFSTAVDKLYTLEIPQERDVPLPDLIEEGGFTGAPVGNFQGYDKFQNWWNKKDDDEEGEKKATERGKSKEAERGKTESNVVFLGEPPDLKGGTIRGYDGIQITLKEFDGIKAKGCSWCKQPIEHNVTFAFLSEDHLVCGKCMTDKHEKAALNDDDEWDGLDDPAFDDGPRYPGLGPDNYNDLGQEKSPEYKRVVLSAKQKVSAK